MTSSDPKSQTAMEVDEDDDEEYEYEEIEVEEEVEVGVEDDEEEEEVEYEEVEVEEEEEEEVEEVEEEVEYEEVEEEVEVEEEGEEIEYEEVEEEVDDEDDDSGDDVEEIGDTLVTEANGDDVIRNDTISHMDHIQHDMPSKQGSITIECDTNVSLNTNPIDPTKQGNEDEDEMLAIPTKTEANILSNIECFKSEEQNKEGIETSLAHIGTPDVPNLLGHGVGVHSHHCSSGLKDEPGYGDKSVPTDVLVQQGDALDSSNAQMGEDNATGFKDTTVDVVEPVDDVNHKASRSPLEMRHMSPFLGAGYEDGNKRRAVICEYFAKGWCIKGSSCRFLHKRDHLDAPNHKVQGDILPSNSKHLPGNGSSALNDNDKTTLYGKEVASASPCNGKSNSIFDPKEAEGDNFKENYQFYGYNYSKYRLPPQYEMGETVSMRKRYLIDVAKIPDMNTSKGPSKYKSSFVPYNWEPSVPFRPSVIIPSIIKTSPDVQYDPLRDSIDQPDKQSISGLNSLENNKNLDHGVWDKNYFGHDKDVGPADSGATSTTGVKNKNIFEDENNPAILSSVKDSIKASKNAGDVSFDLQDDGKVIVMENEQKSGHLDEDNSRVMKYFRGALIEFVKELMKPVWHEGRLSKDVYKVIVQKAEDKIMSTLSLNKVPNTSESIKEYLSLSRPKILKLIQAYVDKYGKF